MKCDDLKDHWFNAYPTDSICKAEVYGKKEVDEAIDELKEKLNRAKAHEDVLVTDNRNLQEKVKELKNLVRENSEHYKRNEEQILEASEKLKAENERLKVIISQKEDAINKAVNIGYSIKKEREATKRSLWLARAERAKAKASRWYYSTVRYDVKFDIVGRRYGKGILKSPEEWYKTWINVGRKCRAKAEEYK